jgi:hypothetical protein
MLPKVKKEILDSTSVSMSSSEDSREFLKEKIKMIKEENPILFRILTTMIGRDDWSEKEKNCYVLGAVQFYIFLSMQDESDELMEIFPLD